MSRKGGLETEWRFEFRVEFGEEAERVGDSLSCGGCRACVE